MPRSPVPSDSQDNRAEGAALNEVAERIGRFLQRERPSDNRLDRAGFQQRNNIAEGLPNKQIATSLGIGERTVKTHLKSAMNKLDVDNRAHAAVVAVQRGLLG
jgi:ATP/maltotriose-dependent transcriptional regulator MalT